MPKFVRPAQGGINRSHPMSRRLVLSWQASGQAGGYNLHDKTRGVLTGTPTIGTSAFLGTTYNLTGSNSITFTRAYASALVENVATFWIIGSPTDVTDILDLMASNTGDTVAWDVSSSSAGALAVIEFGGIQSSGITLVANAPYLLIVSMVYSTANFLALRLDTGVITTGTATVAPPTATLGGCIIGANPAAVNSCYFNFAAAALSYTGFSIPMLLSLANDPWGPWRPPSFPTGQMVRMGPITGTAAGTATASGASVGADKITGTSAGTAVATGAATQGAIVGAAAGAAAGTGAATAQGAIAGVAAGAPIATGAAAAQGAIVGAAAGIAVGTGASVGADKITGISAGTAVATGAATQGAIVGAAAGAAAGIGAAVATDLITGVSAGASSATGAAAQGVITGAAAGIAVGTGASAGVEKNTGISAGTAVATGATVQGTQGAAASNATASGTAAAQGAIVGAAAGATTALGAATQGVITGVAPDAATASGAATAQGVI